jgi:hypothetical protein
MAIKIVPTDEHMITQDGFDQDKQIPFPSRSTCASGDRLGEVSTQYSLLPSQVITLLDEAPRGQGLSFVSFCFHQTLKITYIVRRN